MIQCSRCNFSLASDAVACPRCGESSVDMTDAVAHQAEERMIKIARFTNAAEAGYFAHELSQHARIESQVLAEEDFDAVGGVWSTRFALLVRESDLTYARDLLQQLSAEDEYTEAEDANYLSYERNAQYSSDEGDVEQSRFEIVDPRDLRSGDTEESGVNWIPIVLTLAAGSVAFWVVRGMQDRPKPAVMAAPGGPHRGDLWDELTKEQSPWVQDTQDGQGKRELVIDPDRRAIIVREDLNGDGLYETETPYTRAALRR